ncbi:MAG: NADH-quinone oxidoreductase subunit N [Bacteroidia bacterium]|nr:NADH-quinone oxidoreductase subunit N [Bacteroidia bacterium]
MDNNWLPYLTFQLEKLGKLGGALYFEWILLGLILISLIQSWAGKKIQGLTKPVLVPLLIGSAGLGLMIIFESGEAFGGMMMLDEVGHWGKIILFVTTALVLLVPNKEKPPAEFYPLMLGGVLGASVAICSQNLLLSILALELLSLVSYVMVALEESDRASSKSALQYVLFGLFSSAISLYGLSWLYGFTGTFDLADPAFQQGINQMNIDLLLLVLVMLVGTFMFKLSAFPFHFWTPQVYEKASYTLISYLSSIPKIAGTLVFLRLFYFLSESSHYKELQLLLLVFAGISITWGNLSALVQENFKPMMAFSGIAHAGYLLMGVAWMNELGQSAVVYYIAAYVIMNLAAILAASVMDDSDYYPDWAGKSASHLFPAISMVICLVALTGLPPSIGFISKLYLISAGIAAMGTENEVAIITILSLTVINTLISLFFYLKPAVWMFLRKGPENTATNRLFNWKTDFILLALTITIVVFGVYGSGQILDYIQQHLWK